MKILSAIISGIWNTVTFMDKEQRALVAHVLAVSQAHPKSFSHQGGGDWQSKGLKISYDKTAKTVELSSVVYQLGWRANAILAKHFAMLHICLHHEHIGKALSGIDAINDGGENELEKRSVMEMMDGYTYDKQPEWTTDIDLTKWIGKTVDVKLRNGVVIDAVDITAEPRAVVYIVGLGEIPYTKHGNYWHSQLDGRDVVAIRLST